MKKLYNAGSMFNEGQWAIRKLEGKNLRAQLSDLEILNPVDFDTNQGNSPTPLSIWEFDYECVRDSDYLIFELDSFDTGTIMEFAIAVEMAKTSQPDKFLVPIISDFRFTQQSLMTHLPEFSMNHFVYGAIFDRQLNDEGRIFLARSHNQAIEIIKNHEAYLKTQDNKFIQEMNNLDIKHIYDNGSMFK